jgi:hypothetical protein
VIVPDAGRALVFGVTPGVVEDLRARGLALPAGVAVLDVTRAERAGMVVCGFPPSHYPAEDVLTWCHDCRRAIVHRPHMPRAPMKVCIPCAARRVVGDRG